MGLFSPRLSDRELEYVRSRMTQLHDSVNLLNTTVKPEVFFKRLNFALDILLDLRAYEKYGVFKGSSPSIDYNRIVRNMGSTVDDFINRAIADNRIKITSLKTDSAKLRNQVKFAESLKTAFNNAGTYWIGDRGKPHYSGPLFTRENFGRVQSLIDELENRT